ncbi:MAG: bifunctional 4-hydroxy-3-methylbut-2-enyl diphosphate reductase/30S ribosomal protein S1 [Clostridiales bacterium]|nr:bifunctional 4-hydroxy-3-methylbut-2-enyl diphosphate reductase/30S ribosomal protein S1 [Clostridiales bacterium]
MKIKIAKTAGFCYGVNRAVGLVEQAIADGKATVTFGPIAHNRHLVRHFEELGVKEISALEKIPDGCTVIIRSHGIPRAVYEALEQKNVEIIDATCPSVKRIHSLVAKAEEQGRQPVIIGTPTHPEIIAIAGWCKHPLVFSNAEELKNWLISSENNKDLPITMVSQTTSTQFLWDSCKKIVKKECTNREIFDTICRATENRQTEAAELAATCDAMIVVGDRNSSNTGRLAHICSEHCARVDLIDCADELEPAVYQNCHTVGITAGASTPAWIIKEVNKTMSEITNVDAVVEESFEAMLENSIKTLNTGDKVFGTVTAIGSTEVQVDLGTKHAGYIPYDEVSADPTVKPEDILKVGDEIEVFVVRVNDQEGTVQLSRKKLEGMKVWDDVEKACEEKTPVEGIITEENKGGVVANVKGVRVFIPASQTGIAKGGDLSELKGQTMKMKITEFNRARRRVVGSIRAVSGEARKAAIEKVWSEIEVGKKYTGTVKSLTSYGAFVDIGGVDGMVHISELSWDRIKTPDEVVKVGDSIDVFVIKFDAEKKKISLGYKTPETNPWNQFCAKYSVGDIANVKVVKLVDFGAFAEIIPGVDGLIHISQVADHRVEKVADVLSEGQEVEAKIIDVDADRKRISLSIRALLEPVAEEEAPAEEAAPVEEAPAEEAAE